MNAVRWSRERKHSGFTMLEVLIALGILSVALLMVAQVGLWSWRERARSALRSEALETAANILEAARAQRWEALTPAWAAAQRLPESLSSRLVESKLSVRVEPEPARPHVKRVTVTIHGSMDTGDSLATVQLVGLVSARSAAAESKP
jgi:prepilin-type N-terminal cleavage/methylation domain-containing protein